jgi:hypothetical protein
MWECIELVLGDTTPEPEYGRSRVLQAWLAERNLGLVPIARGEQVRVAGHWIARVRVQGHDHAVVMFGSPSGPLHDPAGALARAEGSEGWLLRGSTLDSGRTNRRTARARPSARSWVCSLPPRRRSPLVRVDSVKAVAGHGLEATVTSTATEPSAALDAATRVTLVEAEKLDVVDLSWNRRAATSSRAGSRWTASSGNASRSAQSNASGEDWPSPALTRSSPGPASRPLVHRAGLRADILRDGEIKLGDSVVPADGDPVGGQTGGRNRDQAPPPS